MNQFDNLSSWRDVQAPKSLVLRRSKPSRTVRGLAAVVTIAVIVGAGCLLIPSGANAATAYRSAVRNLAAVNALHMVLQTRRNDGDDFVWTDNWYASQRFRRDGLDNWILIQRDGIRRSWMPGAKEFEQVNMPGKPLNFITSYFQGGAAGVNPTDLGTIDWNGCSLRVLEMAYRDNDPGTGDYTITVWVDQVSQLPVYGEQESEKVFSGGSFYLASRFWFFYGEDQAPAALFNFENLKKRCTEIAPALTRRDLTPVPHP